MITELLEEDKTTVSNVSLDFINSYLYNQNKFIANNHLSNQSFEVLLIVVNYYVRTSKGISVTAVLKEHSYSHGYYHKIYSFMNTLYNNGFIEYVGNGWNNCKLFAPTDKAISSINNLVASIEV